MVLNATNVSYLCRFHLSRIADDRQAHSFETPDLTPTTHVSVSEKSNGVSHKSNDTSQSRLRMPLSIEHRQDAIPSMNRISDEINGVTDPLPSRSELKSQPVVLIPTLPSTQRSIDYKYYPEDNGIIPHKGESETSHVIGSNFGKSLDQLSAAEEALQSLDELMCTISEAETNYDHGSVAGADHVLLTEKCDDDQSLRLSATGLVRLENALRKVISHNRLGDVALDQLLHLQRLCEFRFDSCEVGEIYVNPDMDESETAQWLERVESADLALRSGRIILYSMTGGREEKRLFSEDLVQKILAGVRKVMENCIIPVVEARSSGPLIGLFNTAHANKKAISQLLHNVNKVFALTSILLDLVGLGESAITTLEFFLVQLLFVENAQAEKDSVLGITKFEALRRTCMDIIAEIFSRYPSQRIFLMNEILSSLQKLPVTRQHARQFKLADGKNIQLVSVLLVRLIQVSDMLSTSKLSSGSTNFSTKAFKEGEDAHSEGKSPYSSCGETPEFTRTAREHKRQTNAGGSLSSEDMSPLQRLANQARSHYSTAATNAQYIIRFFVRRASTASRTGDQPHRHLLDIFTEDLIAILNSPEWPGAELLIRALLSESMSTFKADKSAAPAKNMALELLGSMGSAILDLAAGARNSVKHLEGDESDVSRKLTQSLEDIISGKIDTATLTHLMGPYHLVVEYLGTIDRNDVRFVSAQGYVMAQWSKALCFGARSPMEAYEEPEWDMNAKDAGSKLLKCFAQGKWSSSEYGTIHCSRIVFQFLTAHSDLDPVTSHQARLAYILLLLSSEFCRSFDSILMLLLKSISSDQITVRTKSLKSVTQMLEKDPGLLDRAPQIVGLIVKSVSDASSQVRDSALVLVGKCVLLKPSLENDISKCLMDSSNDPTVGVRKRAMRILKDIYSRTSRTDIKASIANSLMPRAKDSDTGVVDLAHQILEDLWLSPFWEMPGVVERSASVNVALREQVVLIIRTIQGCPEVESFLCLLLRRLLSKESKNVTNNNLASKSFVAIAFEGIIDSEDLPGKPEQQQIFLMLKVFAKADPTLFTSQQLQYLQPYIGSLAPTDDLVMFRCVVVILRYVLPVLPAIQQDFMAAVQRDLLGYFSKTGGVSLDEVVACFWTITMELRNAEKFTYVLNNILERLRNAVKVDFTSPAQNAILVRTKRTIQVAGYVGKYCDFEPQITYFRNKFSEIGDGSVVGFLIRSIRPFASIRQPLELRISALENLAVICQVWPKHYTSRGITNDFQRVLVDGPPALQMIVLSSFRDFFALQDRPPEVKKSSEEDADVSSTKTFKSVLAANDRDGAAALIAQGFLKDILYIALHSQDKHALVATQCIASISRQGLVHPKECGPALVALETSTISEIASTAFHEHQNLHQHHESMFEREYMRAIHLAFVYQRDIAKDSRGAVGQPFRSKLRKMFEIVNMSKGKSLKKFLTNFCERINFDPVKLDISTLPPPHLEYSRFLIENIAFFEYTRVDDLQHVVSCMEHVVTSTGAGVAHAINKEIHQFTTPPTVEDQINGRPTTPGGAIEVPREENMESLEIDPSRLRQLTTAAMILSMLWEVRRYTRLLYGEKTFKRRDSKLQGAVKDLNKAPSKILGVASEPLMATISNIFDALSSKGLMLERCKLFAEIMSIDNEHTVAGEANEDFEGHLGTPSVEPEVGQRASSGDRPCLLKRKSSISIPNTPSKKPRARPVLGGRKKSGKSPENDNDDYY